MHLGELVFFVPYFLNYIIVRLSRLAMVSYPKTKSINDNKFKSMSLIILFLNICTIEVHTSSQLFWRTRLKSLYIEDDC